MPYRITKKKVSDIHAAVLVAPIDSELSTAYRYGLDQRRVNEFRKLYTRLVQGDIIVMHQTGQRYEHVMFVIQSDKEDSVQRLTYCYRDILSRAAVSEWRSIALPLFSLSKTAPLPDEEIYKIALGEIKNTLRDSPIDIFLAAGAEQKAPVGDDLLEDLTAYVVSKIEGAARYDVWYDRDFSSLSSGYADLNIRLDKPISSSAFEEFLQDDDELPFGAEEATEQPAPAHTPPAVHHSYALPPISPREELKIRQDAEEQYRPVLQQIREEEIRKAVFDPTRNRIETEESFSEAIVKIIRKKHMTDPECYNRANLSRAVFNKIKQAALNPDERGYKPSKTTALALALALRLSLDETNDLLKKAGLALSHSDKGDIIVEYCLLNNIYDIFEVNDLLFRFDQPLLGSF